MTIPEKSLKKRRRRLAMELLYRRRFFEYRPMLTSIVAMAVFTYFFRILIAVPKNATGMFLPWLSEQALGMSLFEQLMVLSALFTLYALLDIASSVQRKRTSLLGGFNYCALTLIIFGFLIYGLSYGERQIGAFSNILGPMATTQGIIVDYPEPEDSEYSHILQCHPENSVLVSLDSNRLVIGDDIVNPIELQNGRFLPEHIKPHRIGPFVPLLGKRLQTYYHQWQNQLASKVSSSDFIFYRLIIPSLDPGFEVWPRKGTMNLVIKAAKQVPFETIEKTMISAGESGFDKCCLWGSTFRVRLYPNAMLLPKFAVLKYTVSQGEKLNLRIHLKKDGVNLSFNRPSGQDTQRIEIAGKPPLDIYQQHLKDVKELWRYETSCFLRVDPDVPLIRVVEALAVAQGTNEQPLFPDVYLEKRILSGWPSFLPTVTLYLR